MATERIINFPRQGEARFWAATGGNYVAFRADDPVTTYTLTWPGAAPAGNRFVQVAASGAVSYVTGASGTLDDAYDSGGAGSGRIVTSDTGPIESSGAGGLQVTHSAPVINFETTGVGEYNFRATCGQATDVFEIQRGDQDADISDDTFDALFSLDGANRRLGVNTAAPGTLGHLVSPSGDAKLTIEAPAASDPTIIFTEDSTARFEIGYDQSAGGLVVGVGTIATDAIFVENTTGDIGLNEATPDAKLHATAGASLVGLLEATTGTARLGLRDSATTDENTVGIQAVGDDAQILCGGSVLIHFDGTDDRVGIGDTTPSAKLDVMSNVASQITFFVNQDNASGRGILIDSEATSQPLLELEALDTNTRGDITAANTARASDPASPSDGDIWFNATASRWKARLTGNTVSFANVMGPAFGASSTATIATGVVTATTVEAGVIVLAAETGTADTLDTLAVTGSDEVIAGDTVILRADAGDTITLGHATGNLLLNNSTNKVLDNSDQILLIWDGTNWRQLAGLMQLP